MMKIRVFFIVIAVSALILTFWLAPEPAALKEINLTVIGQLLATLFVIALFLERALDVFLTTWRAQASEQLDLKIQWYEQQVSELQSQLEEGDNEKAKELNTILKTLKQAQQEKLKYRSKTRLIALWSGLFFGILISAVGIRTLETVINTNGMPAKQISLFRILDVLLTGGLLAGGSESLHKLTELYRNFVETTSLRAKKTVEQTPYEVQPPQATGKVKHL